MNSELFVSLRSKALLALFLASITALLVVARSIHFLLFHTLAELVAITVSFSLFTLAWACRKYILNGYLIILGAAYGAIGLVDVFHTLTFKGLNILPEMTLNHPTQFWLIARTLEAVALVVAPLYVLRQPNFEKTTLAFLGPALLGCVAVFAGFIPDTYIEGVGLTPLKIYTEYFIILLLAIGLFLLSKNRGEFPRDVYLLLNTSVIFAIATEICFINYVSFYDLTNELGHYFRFTSVVLAYLALVVTGVQRPTELLYRELAEKEQELRSLAFLDPLTRLPNRRLLLDRMKQATLNSDRQDSYGAVLFIDLDRFKALNDEHGHNVGDLLLVEVSERLRDVVRESDTVARLGGDEFIVVLEGLGSIEVNARKSAHTVANKIRCSLEQESNLDGLQYQCSASIGIELFQGRSLDPDQLLKNADAAMYRDKDREN